MLTYVMKNVLDDDEKMVQVKNQDDLLMFANHEQLPNDYVIQNDENLKIK